MSDTNNDKKDPEMGRIATSFDDKNVSSEMIAMEPPLAWDRPRIAGMVWTVFWVMISIIILIIGLTQAYTMDPTYAGYGAPPVTAMSGVFGVAIFIETIILFTGTSMSNIVSTVFYRYVCYASLCFFGFFSMAFYAATGEGLAAFGCATWVFQASAGALFVAHVVATHNKGLQVTSREQLRHCCGIGCCTKSGWGMCCRWTLWVFALLFFVQAACVLSDQLVYLQSGAGTNGTPITLISATSVTGKVSNLAIYCAGTQGPTDPVVLLEAGGGSGLGSMVPLLNNLTKTYGIRACAYDRAGYGFSQTSLPYPDVNNAPVMLYEILGKLGEKGPYVCAGHSAGGTECRSFQRLYPQNVTGLVMLDAFCNVGACNIEQIWNNAMGLGPNAYSNTYQTRLSLVDACRYFATMVFLRLGTAGSNGLMNANLGGNMAWNAQYFGFRPALNKTQVDSTVEAMWWTPAVLGNIPLVIATGGAVNKTCAEKGYEDNENGKQCTQFLQRQNATTGEIQKYLSTSSLSIAFDCPTCDHGYVQRYPGLAAMYVMFAVEASKTGTWPNNGTLVM